MPSWWLPSTSGTCPLSSCLGDDIMHPGAGILAGMLATYERYGHSVVALKEVPSRGHLLLRLRRRQAPPRQHRAGRGPRRKADARGGAVQPGRDGPVRVRPRDLGRPCRAPSPVGEARSSSPTRSRRSPNASPCTAGRSAKGVSTSATSWTTCRRRWSWPSNARTSALRSASSWWSAWPGTLLGRNKRPAID